MQQVPGGPLPRRTAGRQALRDRGVRQVYFAAGYERPRNQRPKGPLVQGHLLHCGRLTDFRRSHPRCAPAIRALPLSAVSDQLR